MLPIDIIVSMLRVSKPPWISFILLSHHSCIALVMMKCLLLESQTLGHLAQIQVGNGKTIKT